MITILYFARIRESLGRDEEKIEYTDDLNTVQALKEKLMSRGDSWRSTLAENQGLLVAVNQEMVGLDHPLDDGDEIAFFPPVTGG